MATKRKASNRTDVARDAFVKGSGNVFADLGLRDPDERLAKANLARQIGQLISGLGLSQTEAAKRLRIDQPKVSALLRGRLNDFSTDRLIRFITALDRDVIITVRSPKDAARPRVRVLVEV